ncbi:MAG TPA: hypothetical protein VH352_17790, partial [Pseudonocardiaceae bacterium]|nr:hypothetical protein [Pseudonocardiaceae bacterium]
MRTGLSTLAELADEICRVRTPTRDNWQSVNEVFRDWADTPGRPAELKSYVGNLPAAQAADVVARSKEATTHFAWCLFDRPDDAFSLWLHEYKPSRDWLPGYANSVHNHRYH